MAECYIIELAIIATLPRLLRYNDIFEQSLMWAEYTMTIVKDKKY